MPKQDKNSYITSDRNRDYHQLNSYNASSILYKITTMHQPPLLYINVDHIATIRQSRKTSYPDPLKAAQLAEQAGADGITVHLREDRRHIIDSDVPRLRQALETRLNLEIALTDEMLDIARKVLPDSVCLVPEKRQELTTEGGLNLDNQTKKLAEGISRLQKHNIKVTLFIDPIKEALDASKKLGTECVELHTGTYADSDAPNELQKIIDASAYGDSLGLEVHAGHGLHYQNVQPIAAIPQITELHIGHAIVAQALFDGMSKAVEDMKKLVKC